ncbi:MAG: recombination protein O N-terminal domain-containing protein [Firmicutes bacterium]|nr:recombination protein O N-terminal domain-containing protein [Bacillota bacterium]
MVYIIYRSDVKNTEIVFGIVIKTKKVAEADLRVTLLCAEGLKNFTASGVLKKGAKLTSSTQLFTIAEFSIIGHKIVGAHVVNPCHDITKDIKRYYLACAICEVVRRVASVGETKDLQKIFLLTVGALSDLSDGSQTRAVFTEYFTAVLVTLGYGIDEKTDINTAYVRYLDIQIPDTRMYL